MNEKYEEVKKILDDNKKIITKSFSYDYEEVAYLKKTAKYQIEVLESLEEFMRENEELRSVLLKIHNVYKKRG